MVRRAKILITAADIAKAFGYDLDAVDVRYAFVYPDTDTIAVVMEGDEFPDIDEDTEATVVSVKVPSTATDEQIAAGLDAAGYNPDGSPKAECAACRQGEGNDCQHFETR